MINEEETTVEMNDTVRPPNQHGTLEGMELGLPNDTSQKKFIESTTMLSKSTLQNITGDINFK